MLVLVSVPERLKEKREVMIAIARMCSAREDESKRQKRGQNLGDQDPQLCDEETGTLDFARRQIPVIM